MKQRMLREYFFSSKSRCLKFSPKKGRKSPKNVQIPLIFDRPCLIPEEKLILKQHPILISSDAFHGAPQVCQPFAIESSFCFLKDTTLPFSTYCVTSNACRGCDLTKKTHARTILKSCAWPNKRVVRSDAPFSRPSRFLYFAAQLCLAIMCKAFVELL